KLIEHPNFEESDEGLAQAPDVDIAAFPISIDTKKFTIAAKQAEQDEKVQSLRRQFGSHRTLFIGVDRLDYTKGIDRRLEASELALESGKMNPDDVRFVQIAVPSRVVVPQYQEISDRVDGLVGRINGTFSGIGDAIVHYSRRGLA